MQFKVSSSTRQQVTGLWEETSTPRGDPLIGRTSKLHTERPASLSLLAVQQQYQQLSYCAALSGCKWHSNVVEICEQSCLNSTTYLQPSSSLTCLFGLKLISRDAAEMTKDVLLRRTAKCTTAENKTNKSLGIYRHTNN